jgi:hypothetical protein
LKAGIALWLPCALENMASGQGYCPILAGLQAALTTGMVEASDRFGWWAVAGILILTVWAVTRLWLAD